jgi:hypothetical protein
MRICSWHSIALTAALAAALTAAPRLPAAPVSPRAALPENWEARAQLRATIFAPVREAAARGRAIITQSGGAARVSFEPDVQAGALYLVFANESGMSFPVAGPGTFIIKRSLVDGSFLQAKVFLRNDAGCYLRLFPRDDRTAMDIYLFDEPYQSQLMIPAAFDRLLTSPVSRILELTASSVNWSLVLPPEQSSADLRVEATVSAIRARLAGLRDMDDGAMNAEGAMVFIASGAPAPSGRGGFNCSGFAKWVIDGFYAPLAHRGTDIAVLKSRNAGLAGTRWSARYEEELDPWFGLDWSRGLARSLAQARTGRVPDDSEIDVRDQDRLAYVKDVGYPVTKLPYLLYFLARKSPGTFYLGSVNDAAFGVASEGTPVLRQHHHVIVLFPWFDADGGFRVAVMERNKETSLESLSRRYAREYVHLERVDASGDFVPPSID